MNYAAKIESKNPSMKLHSSVDWFNLSEGQLQLRLPTGDHITFDEHGEEVGELLALWRDGVEEGDDTAEIGDDFKSDLIDLLMRTGSLVPDGEPLSEGLFRAAADFHGRAVRSKLSRPVSLTRGPLSVEGRGVVYNLVVALVERLGLADTPELVIACADFDDRQTFGEINRRCVSDKTPVTFVRWGREHLLIGPFVLPEGPCYECYNTRLLASSRFPKEMNAVMAAGSHKQLQPDIGFRSLIEFAVTRHLELICAGAFHLARVGFVERWNPFGLQLLEHAPLSRVPLCETCGRTHASDPMIAVRDLI